MDPEEWANASLKTERYSGKDRVIYKDKHLVQIENYDIDESVKQLDSIYTNLLSRKKK